MSAAGQNNTSLSRKPSNSAFKQQRLPAWQPILTAGTVLPTFFVIGVTFIPIGVGLLYFSNNVKELVLDYTHCTSINQVYPNGTQRTCAEVLQENIDLNCTCKIDFTLPEKFEGSVYLYYGLTNFYQNHRRYVKSRDDHQLLGVLGEPSAECDPFARAEDSSGQKKVIVPCGAIANSLFNDTLELMQGPSQVHLLRKGIAWPSDKKMKFKNPPGEDLSLVYQNYTKPTNWKKHIWQLDEGDPENNGMLNEDLIVWMRTAALPNFRKLYRRIDHSAPGFSNGLPANNYSLIVRYAYPVTAFGGTKRMVLSNTSLLGGKNPFLGIAYIVVGCLCLLFGIVFLVIHIKFGKSTTEMTNVTPRSPYQ